VFVAALAVASAGMLALAPQPEAAPGGGPDIAPHAIESLKAADLHNVIRYGRGVVGGSAPEDDGAFAALAAMGVKTILSVDGSTPMVDAAANHGIRYIHVPTVYAGVGRKQALQIAKALRDAPRPIYVHCHHGKHRGPAAAALGLVELGELDNDAALGLMIEAGTSPAYPGLFACVREARPIDQRALDDASITLPSVATVSGMVAHMVAIDTHFENLKTLRANNWAVPADHPDLVPAAEAGVVEGQFRSLAADASMDNYDEAFAQEVADARLLAQLLEDALAANDAEGASAQYGRLAASCSRCHQVYRNTVDVR